MALTYADITKAQLEFLAPSMASDYWLTTDPLNSLDPSTWTMTTTSTSPVSGNWYYLNGGGLTRGADIDVVMDGVLKPKPIMKPAPRKVRESVVNGEREISFVD